MKIPSARKDCGLDNIMRNCELAENQTFNYWLARKLLPCYVLKGRNLVPRMKSLLALSWMPFGEVTSAPV